MRILLIGNYEPDAQESMLRYAELMRVGLSEAGHAVTMAAPRRALNRNGRPPHGMWKLIGYMDKYFVSPSQLARAADQVDLVHVCDHANSMYVPRHPRIPYVVTCHDLLAVRGAMGEDTDCPTGFAGRQLQRLILSGLRRATALACVSGATLKDAQRLLAGFRGKLLVAPNALSYPYRELAPAVIGDRLVSIPRIAGPGSYVLHVGSNLRRKNRESVLRTIHNVASSWDGKVVFAGQPLSAELWHLAHELAVADRIVEVTKPSNELLEGLYNGAVALLFPSRFEGFGWPIIEAQASGCPVICSRREPMIEVAGAAALLCDADDIAQLSAAVLALVSDASVRDDLRRRGLVNARRFDRANMISQFLSLYRQLAPV